MVLLLTTSKLQGQEFWSCSTRGTNGPQGARGSGFAQHSPEAEEGRTDAGEQMLHICVVQTLAGMMAAGFCAGQAVRVG